MMDVAKLAQVSASTVSLYLRKPAAVSPAAGQEIARATLPSTPRRPLSEVLRP